MKKYLSILMIATMVVFTGCDDNDDNENKEIIIPNQSELNQSAYADEETSGGITFTATTAWTADIRETMPVQQSMAAATAPMVRSKGLPWLSLDKYEGAAGQFTLTITLEPNYTGSSRSAEIDIKAGNTIITIKVTQEGETQTGELPKPPVSVTGVTLNKTSLTLNAGSKETLTATVQPDNATVKSIRWSSNGKAVTVDPSTGEVTAMAEGTATITATSTVDESKSATCYVTVSDKRVPNGGGTFTYSWATKPLKVAYAEQEVSKNGLMANIWFYEEKEHNELVFSEGLYLNICFPIVSDRLPAGVYSWNRELSSGNFYVQKGVIGGVTYYAAEGTLTVMQAGDEYTLTLNLKTFDEGASGTITGTYKGKIKVVG